MGGFYLMTKTQKQYLLDRHNTVAYLEALKKQRGELEKSAEHGASRMAYIDILINVAKLMGQKGSRKVRAEFHRVDGDGIVYTTYHLL
jgi:hypothetical protein